MAKKDQLFIPGGSLVKHGDGTFSEVTKSYLNGVHVVGADETATKLFVLSQMGIVPGISAHPNSTMKAAGVIALSAEVQLMADKQAVVTIQWGVPADPPLDATSWLIETYSESVKELRGIDVFNAQIKQEYRWDGNPVPNVADDKLRFKPGVRVSAFDNIVHLYARRHISYEEAASKNFITAPLLAWPTIYTNWVNKEIDRLGMDNVPAGVWLCRGVRVTTRNNGKSWLVGAQFMYRRWGHEDYDLFVYGPIHNQVPSDIDIPAGMKTPWPTVRKSTAGQFGAVRPQMLMGTRNFNVLPFKLKLAGYTPSKNPVPAS